MFTYPIYTFIVTPINNLFGSYQNKAIYLERQPTLSPTRSQHMHFIFVNFCVRHITHWVAIVHIGIHVRVGGPIGWGAGLRAMVPVLLRRIEAVLLGPTERIAEFLKGDNLGTVKL